MIKLPDKKLFRPDEVAKYLQVSTSTIYNWIDNGTLSAEKIGGKLIRIDRESIEGVISVIE
jgi:excisionase family DNA binding protein